MLILAPYALLVTSLGLLSYVFAPPNQPKLAELGRIAFACGLLVVAYVLAGYVVRVG